MGMLLYTDSTGLILKFKNYRIVSLFCTTQTMYSLWLRKLQVYQYKITRTKSGLPVDLRNWLEYNTLLWKYKKNYLCFINLFFKWSSSLLKLIVPWWAPEPSKSENILLSFITGQYYLVCQDAKKPRKIHVNVWQKPSQVCKVINLHWK